MIVSPIMSYRGESEGISPEQQHGKKDKDESKVWLTSLLLFLV